MLIKKIENSFKRSQESWRDVNVYRVGDVIMVKYQYAGVGLKIRRFTGICIGIKKKNLGSVLVLRNVISNKGVELSVFLDSNKVIAVQKLNYKMNKVRRSKLYYLRNKPLSKSKIKL